MELKSILHIAVSFFIAFLCLACSNTNRNSNAKPAPVKSTSSQTIQREDGKYSATVQWIADTTHSSIIFKTRHTAVHDVVGWVNSYRIELTSQRFDFSDAKIRTEFDMRSLVMPNPEMAGNVMSSNFIDAQTYPFAKYNSRSIQYTGLNTFKVFGELSLKESTVPVELDVIFNGFAFPDSHGLPGFTVNGKFSRFDFGIGQRDTLENSLTPILDDTIYITGNLRFYAN